MNGFAVGQAFFRISGAYNDCKSQGLPFRSQVHEYGVVNHRTKSKHKQTVGVCHMSVMAQTGQLPGTGEKRVLTDGGKERDIE